MSKVRDAARTLKNKKGMTLIELIVAMVVFSIITMSVAAVFAPMLSVYHKANDLAESNTLLDNLSEELVNDISDAYGISLSLEGTLSIIPKKNASPVFYSVPNGRLCRNGTPIRDAAFYKSKTVGVTYHSIDGNRTEILSGTMPSSFYVRVTIFRDGDTAPMASRDYAVKPLGF